MARSAGQAGTSSTVPRRTRARDGRDQQAPQRDADRPLRANRGRRHPDAPVILSPFAGHTLSLDGVLERIFVGETISAAHTDIFGTLLDRGVLPSVDRISSDSAASYLQRSIDALCSQQPPSQFQVAFGLEDQEGEDRRVPSERLAITIRHTSPLLIEIKDFDDALVHGNRFLVPSLVADLVDATERTFDAIGPTQAFELAMWTRFGDDPVNWYDDQRAEAAYSLEVEEARLTRADMRRYFRKYGIITPGELRRRLGPHFYRERLAKQRLSLEACEQRVATLPKHERHLGELFLAQTRALAEISKQLGAFERPEDEVLYHSEDWCGVTTPGMIVDRDGDASRPGLVVEIVDELYEQLMNGGEDFRCNYAFSISTDPADSERLRSTLKLFERATVAMNAIENAVAAYNGDA